MQSIPTVEDIIRAISEGVFYGLPGSIPPSCSDISIPTLCRELALSNSEQWLQEDIARLDGSSDSQVATAKRTIDILNRRRVDLINLLHQEFARLTNNKAPSSNISYVSPADVVDRLTVQNIKISALRRRLGSDPRNTELKALVATCERDFIHESNHLRFLIEKISDGSVRIEQRFISKVYVSDFSSNAKNSVENIKREINDCISNKDAAWSLYEQYRSDMRGFRDEEYKLAGIYSQFITFVTTGLVATVAFAGDRIFIQNMKWFLGLSVLAFFVMFSFRMYSSHKIYSELKIKSENIRVQFAKELCPNEKPSRASKKGVGLQIATLLIFGIFAIVAIMLVVPK